MKLTKRASLAELSARLGYHFADWDLLVEALTHPSAIMRPGDASYQRLEFLGDRVLALVVSQMLFERFPAESEGHLARRLNELVRYETCAEVARELGLGAHLVLGAGEQRAGGSDKPAILGDACEAVIGAIFRDGGFAAARDVVISCWSQRVDNAIAAPRDAKTALQEWAQGRGLPPPTYRLIERSGADHAPEFAISVLIAGHGEADARGGSKRAAEQQAAQLLLTRLEGGERPIND